MSYDENRISDQIEGGLQLQKEMQEEAYKLYEEMFYCIPSKGLSVKEHDEAAKKCAIIAAYRTQEVTIDFGKFFWSEVIKIIKSI